MTNVQVVGHIRRGCTGYQSPDVFPQSQAISCYETELHQSADASHTHSMTRHQHTLQQQSDFRGRIDPLLPRDEMPLRARTGCVGKVRTRGPYLRAELQATSRSTATATTAEVLLCRSLCR
jgi:hypothetical protein